jgi:hypothetical protein
MVGWRRENTMRGYGIRRAGLLLTVLVLVLATISPAGAITDGELDGDGHPQVALMVATDALGNPLWRCSGTFLSETVYLTAGHCTEAPAARAEIWLDSDVESGIPGNGYPFVGEVSGVTHTHPEYQNPYPWFMRDVGVVVLDGEDSVDLPVYGELPEIDQFDAWKGDAKNGVTFTAVGYGLQKAFPLPASWKDVADRVRMVSHPKLIQINVKGSVGDFSMLLSNNANTGGTCFGDSGGPNFLDDSNVVAAVTSFGKNPTCAGQGGVLRLDREWINDWVDSYLVKD